VRVAIGLYLAGVAVALWRTDAAWPTRTAVAVLWPLGPAAFLITVSILLAASLIAFPLAGALVAAGALLLAWWAAL
jgi:hypothetical protein